MRFCLRGLKVCRFIFSVWSLEKSFFRELVPVSDFGSDSDFPIKCQQKEEKKSFADSARDGAVVPIVFPEYVKCQSGDGREFVLELSRNGWAPLSVVHVPCFSFFPEEYLTGHTRFGLFNGDEGFYFEVPYPAWVCLKDSRVCGGKPIYFSRSKSNVEFFYFANNITMFSCKFSLGDMHNMEEDLGLKCIDLRAICYWKEKKIEIVSWVEG